MKRCPQCSRAYTDETLNFCLEDGEWLVVGYAPRERSVHPPIEPSSEASTRPQVLTTERTAILPNTSAVEKPGQTTPKPSRYVVWAVAVAVLLLGGGYAGYRIFNKPPARFSSVKVTRLPTSDNIWSAAISPNGENIAANFSENGKDGLKIWDIATGSSTQIALPPDGIGWINKFSRDGKYLYYLESISKSGSGYINDLYAMPVFGGPPKKLLEKVRAADMSPDRKKWAFVRDGPQPDENSIFSADADGANEKLIITKKGKQRFVPDVLSWAPDNRSVTCGVQADEVNIVLEIISVEDGKEIAFGPAKWWKISSLAWLPDASGIVFTADDSFWSGKVWYMSWPDGELKQLSNETSGVGFRSLTISDDGRTIAVVHQDTVSNIFVGPVGDLAHAKPLPGVFPGTSFPRYFAWTPDGRILFVSSESGNADIWIQNSDGSGKTQLTNDPAFDSSPSVSPDGQTVVFESKRSGSFDIWLMDINGGGERRITNGGINFKPHFSPDGRWIIYEDQLNAQLRKISVDGGDPVTLTDKIVEWNSVSGQSGMIAGLYQGDSDWARLAIFGPDGGAPLKTFEFGGVGDNLWMPDDNSLVLNRFNTIMQQPVTGGDSKLLLDLSPERSFSIALSRDGKTLLFSKGRFLNGVILITDTSKE